MVKIHKLLKACKIVSTANDLYHWKSKKVEWAWFINLLSSQLLKPLSIRRNRFLPIQSFSFPHIAPVGWTPAGLLRIKELWSPLQLVDPGTESQNTLWEQT